jgi:hypothetical protein
MNEKMRTRWIELATTAWRPRDRWSGVQAHPAFGDLDEAGRMALAAAVERQRAIEAGLDPEGLSTTGRLVLARIRGR